MAFFYVVGGRKKRHGGEFFGCSSRQKNVRSAVSGGKGFTSEERTAAVTEKVRLLARSSIGSRAGGGKSGVG